MNASPNAAEARAARVCTGQGNGGSVEGAVAGTEQRAHRQRQFKAFGSLPSPRAPLTNSKLPLGVLPQCERTRNPFRPIRVRDLLLIRMVPIRQTYGSIPTIHTLLSR